MFNPNSVQCKHGNAKKYCEICNPIINHQKKQEYMESLELDYMKKIRHKSKEINPYAERCPNRHLWSEGFRYGYQWAIEHPFDTVIAIQENEDKSKPSNP